MAIDHPPVGMAQISDYHQWVGSPRVPTSTHEIGLRSQPSMELMTALNPDEIVLTPMFSMMAERLQQIAPVKTLSLYGLTTNHWHDIEEMTKTLGELTNKTVEAHALVEGTRALMQSIRSRLKACQPILVLQLVDEKHVRVYGGSSLYQQVFNQLGITNAWTGPVNRWGYRVIGLHELASVSGQLIVMPPFPLGAWERVQRNPLWRRLPAVKTNPPLLMPAIWSLGGLPSAQRFANLLEKSMVCDEQ